MPWYLVRPLVLVFATLFILLLNLLCTFSTKYVVIGKKPVKWQADVGGSNQNGSFCLQQIWRQTSSLSIMQIFHKSQKLETKTKYIQVKQDIKTFSPRPLPMLLKIHSTETQNMIRFNLLSKHV